MQFNGQRHRSREHTRDAAKTHRTRVVAAVVAAIILALLPARAVAPQWAVAVLPSGHEFSLEVAADDEARARGYMFRDRVGEREGMLFIFDTADRQSFWMKNCHVSLDIIWLDSAFRVVHVARDQAPCPDRGECPSVQPPAPARYVVEFAAGTARREGIQTGSSLVILSEPPLR